MLSRSYIARLVALLVLTGCSDDSQTNEAVHGCQDPEASNYNPDATVGENSCEYESGGTDGGGGQSISCSDFDVCFQLSGNSLIYESNVDIYGFQFSHDGCIESAYGGDTEENSLSISFSSLTVLAFSMAGNFIPTGGGTLLNLDGSLSGGCLSNFVASGENGVELDEMYLGALGCEGSPLKRDSVFVIIE